MNIKQLCHPYEMLTNRRRGRTKTSCELTTRGRIYQLGFMSVDFFLQRPSILLIALLAIFPPSLVAASADPSRLASFLISFLNFPPMASVHLQFHRQIRSSLLGEESSMNDTDIFGSYVSPFLMNSLINICAFSAT